MSKKKTGNSFSVKRRKFLTELVKSIDGLNCYYCGQQDLIIHHEHDPDISYKRRATIDHIIPISMGGSKMSTTNWVAACNDCNHRKGHKLEFKRKIK